MSISILFVLIGLLVMGLGVYTFFRQQVRLARGITVIGIVSELIPVREEGKYIIKHGETNTRIERKVRYRPEITFKTQTGRTIKFIAPISTRRSIHAIGDEVEVVYDPQNPKDAQINRFLYLWFFTLMLFGFGLFFAIMGMLGIVLQGV